MTRKFFAFFLLISTLSGCSEVEYKGKTQAEQLYRESKELQEDGSLILASEKLGLLRSKYPYSYYATAAELLLADIQFEQENFVESAASYIRYRDFHPKDKKIAYVIYRIGESFFRQVPETFDRDLGQAVEAIKYFQELQQKFPKSEYAKSAEQKMKVAKEMLQNKERYIADFYFKTEVWEAARFRYLLILQKFRNMELRQHAMKRVLESSLKMKRPGECIRYGELYLKQISDSARDNLEKVVSKCQKLSNN